MTKNHCDNCKFKQQGMFFDLCCSPHPKWHIACLIQRTPNSRNEWSKCGKDGAFFEPIAKSKFRECLDNIKTRVIIACMFNSKEK